MEGRDPGKAGTDTGGRGLEEVGPLGSARILRRFGAKRQGLFSRGELQSLAINAVWQLCQAPRRGHIRAFEVRACLKAWEGPGGSGGLARQVEELGCLGRRGEGVWRL